MFYRAAQQAGLGEGGSAGQQELSLSRPQQQTTEQGSGTFNLCVSVMSAVHDGLGLQGRYHVLWDTVVSDRSQSWVHSWAAISVL